MSHSHTHAPGESHTHSHAQPQQPQAAPAPDPALQALIDEAFRPVPLALTADHHTIHCSPHSLEKCTLCNVDFVNLNRLSKLLVGNPSLLCPPPANVISQKLTQMVTTTKDEGNVGTIDHFKFTRLTPAIQTLFKMGLHVQAIARYNMAASLAVQRPPWEANQFMCEELSTVISNRSAAYFEAHDYISALADAETVIKIRRKWSKGHFRKAKALLGMSRFAEASDAVRLGLAFEPNNTVRTAGFHLTRWSMLMGEYRSCWDS